LIRVDPNTTVFAIWNTTAGGNSMPATPGTGVGQYSSGDSPKNLFDRDWFSYFCNYGFGDAITENVTSGENTGVYMTFPGDPFFLRAFRIVVAGVSRKRDPLRITIEASNQTGIALTLGTSWILIHNGSTGLNTAPTSTNQPGVSQVVNTRASPFSSYRFIFTSKRDADICTDMAELELFKMI
jgi:hypothetical protein